MHTDLLPTIYTLHAASTGVRHHDGEALQCLSRTAFHDHDTRCQGLQASNSVTTIVAVLTITRILQEWNSGTTVFAWYSSGTVFAFCTVFERKHGFRVHNFTHHEQHSICQGFCLRGIPEPRAFEKLLQASNAVSPRSLQRGIREPQHLGVEFGCHCICGLILASTDVRGLHKRSIRVPRYFRGSCKCRELAQFVPRAYVLAKRGIGAPRYLPKVLQGGAPGAFRTCLQDASGRPATVSSLMRAPLFGGGGGGAGCFTRETRTKKQGTGHHCATKLHLQSPAPQLPRNRRAYRPPFAAPQICEEPST